MSLFGRSASIGAELPSYTYSPLPSSNAIRLLELKGSPWRSQSDICFSLRTVNLGKAPEFDALSYTWGNPMTPFAETNSEPVLDDIRRCPIQLDGHTTLVTANLRDALSSLFGVGMKSVGANESRYLWVDALCINQEDLSERAAQVSIMGEIYQAAKEVIVWLGKKDEFTDDAVTAIQHLSKIPQARYSEVKSSDWYDQRRVLRRLGVWQIFLPTHWLGLIGFLNRPWFKRAWVVQEVILARNATVHLETEQFKANAVFMGDLRHYRRLLEARIDLGMAALYIEATRAGVVANGHLALFRYLLQVHRYCEASDPRDMIYAFLGLAWKERLPFTAYPEAIVPDYKISVQKLYTTVAKAMLLSYKDLRFLSHVQDPAVTAIENLPSWVPDFSVKLTPGLLSSLGNCNWNAGGKLSWTPDSRGLDVGSLYVAGVLLDTVVEAAVFISPYEKDYTDPYWTSAFNLTRNLNDCYPLASTESRVEVLWRTLIANTYAKQHPAPAECGQLFFDWSTWAQARMFLWEEKQPDRIPNEERRWETIMRPWRCLLETEPDHSPFRFEDFEDRLIAAVAQGGNPGDYRETFTQFEIDMRSAGQSRRLFRTHQGWLGLGIKSLEIGDEIWILGGAETPFILRKLQHGTYRLIGAAYVHGVMHGEAVESVTELQHITLE